MVADTPVPGRGQPRLLGCLAEHPRDRAGCWCQIIEYVVECSRLWLALFGILSLTIHTFLGSVYLKNRVLKRWSTLEGDDDKDIKPLAASEKASIKNRILPILRAANPQVRAQLVATLQKILLNDFPQNWPEFLQATKALLSAHDVTSVYAGLQCMVAICRTYRFKMRSDRADFDQIVEQTFPQLLNIGNSLVNEDSLEAGEMLRAVLKAYKHAIYVSDRHFQRDIPRLVSFSL